MRLGVVWLRRVGYLVLGLLIMVCLSLYWLLGTSSGTRFAADQVTQRVAGLQIAEVKGSFLDGLILSGIHYETVALDLHVALIAAKVDPSILWNFRRLGIDRFKAQDVVLTLPSSEPAAGPADIVIPAIEPLSLPLRVDVNEFRLINVIIKSAETEETGSTVIDEVVLRGSLDDGQIELAEARVQQARWLIEGVGSIAINEALPAALEISWAMSSDEGSAPAGTLRLNGDRARYRVAHDLRSPYVVETRGHVDVPVGEPVTISLESATDRVELRSGDGPLWLERPTVTVNGRYGDWTAMLESGVGGDKRVEGELSARVAGVFLSPTLGLANLNLDRGGEVSVNGTPEGVDRFNGEVVLEALPLALISPVADGDLNGRYVVVIDTTNGLQATADIVETSGSISGQTISADGALAYRQDIIDFESLIFEVGDNTATLNGRLDLTGNLSLVVSIDAPELGGLIDELSGTLKADGTVNGTIQQPIISARIEPSSIAYGDYRMDGLDATVAWSRERGDIELTANQLMIGERTIERLTLSSGGSMRDHRVAFSARLDDTLAVTTSLAGDYDQSRWQGTVKTLSASSIAFSEELSPVALESSVALNVAAEKIRVAPFCLVADDALSLCGEGNWEDGRLSSRAEINLPNVGVFAKLLLPSWAISGGISGSFELDGAIDTLSGEGRLSVPELTVMRTNASTGTEQQKTVVVAPIESSFVLSDGALSVRGKADIDQAANVNVDLAFDNWLAPASPIAGTVTINSQQLDGLNGLHEAFVFDGGMTNVDITVSGTRSSPQLNSSARVTDLNMTLLPLGVTLQDMTISADANSSDRVTTTVNGRSGDGDFSLDAVVLLTEESGPQLTGKLSADRFRFIDLPDMQGVASLGLALNANPQGYTLNGNVTVDEASVTVRELPASAVRVSSDSRVYDEAGELVVTRDSGALSGALDLSIRLSDQVQLAGFGLRTALSGDLALTQEAGAAPTGVGTMTLTDATYAAYGQKLDVSRGRLIFNGPLDEPRLDVRALREVDDYTVGIDVTGTPTALQSSLFSNPSLPDAEAFSLLLTGRNLGATSAGDGAGLADAALTLGLRQALGVTDGIREAVGLDSLTIAGSGRNGRLLAGKSLSSNLYLQYAYGVFDQVSSVLLRLKINERLSLESSSGETQSVDLIYSVGR
ncbi:MAG: translocation/assembly module TamB domain-containing protein [Woeseiaceae bacterium]